MAKETCLLLLIVFGGIAFLVYITAMLSYLFPRLMFGSGVAARSEARRTLVDEIRGQGAPLASTLRGALVGNVRIRGPLTIIEVYPTGVVVSSMLGTSAVRANEITGLAYNDGILRRGLSITHTSHAIASPIYISGMSRESAFASALAAVVGASNPPQPDKPAPS